MRKHTEMDKKTYWLVDEQDHSLDHYGIIDAYDDGSLIEDGKVDVETARRFPFSVIESEKMQTSDDIESDYDLDYDYCVISEEDAKALCKALGKEFKDDDHWPVLEDWTEEQRNEDEDEKEDD